MSEPTTTQNVRYANTRRTSHILWWVDMRSVRDWLCFMQPWRNRCVFVVAPDVVANAVATLDLFRWYAWRIQSLGFPVALVAQDGLEGLRWPPTWAYDALFVGGTTAWKLSAAADWCIRRAMQAGKWVHVGRVNSQRRIRHLRLDASRKARQRRKRTIQQRGQLALLGVQP